MAIISLRKFSPVLRLLAVGTFSLLLAGCSDTPTAEMKMKEGNPPVFIFAGTGQMYSMLFGRVRYDKTGVRVNDVIWEIAPSSANSDWTLSDYPPVIYGKVPDGFVQTKP